MNSSLLRQLRVEESGSLIFQALVGRKELGIKNLEAKARKRVRNCLQSRAGDSFNNKLYRPLLFPKKLIAWRREDLQDWQSVD